MAWMFTRLIPGMVGLIKQTSPVLFSLEEQEVVTLKQTIIGFDRVDAELMLPLAGLSGTFPVGNKSVVFSTQ